MPSRYSRRSDGGQRSSPSSREVGGLCDFCGAEEAVWGYRADPIQLLITGASAEAGPTLRDDLGTRWLACADCARLIEADDLRGLTERTAALLPPPLWAAPEMVHDALAALQSAFLRTRHPGRTRLIPAAAWRVRPELLPKIRDRLATAWSDRMPESISAALASGERILLPARLVQPRPARAADQRTGEQPTAEQLAVEARPDTDVGVLARFTRDTADALHAAGLYWIDEEFSDLAVHAAGKLPDLSIDARQIPAGAGFVAWAHPIERSQLDGRPLPVVAAHWQRLDEGVWVCFYTPTGITSTGITSTGVTSTGSAPDAVALQRLREQVGWLTPVSSGLAVPYAGARSSDPFTWRAVGALIATWLLIDQPRLPRIHRIRADRSVRRAYARAGRPSPDVRVVRLRDTTTRGAAATSAGGDTRGGDATGAATRAYSHRWWVDPYWRDQPYGPGRRLRRRRLVAGSVRGPDDKPLRLKPTVRVLGSTRTPPPDNTPPDNTPPDSAPETGRADADR